MKWRHFVCVYQMVRETLMEVVLLPVGRTIETKNLPFLKLIDYVFFFCCSYFLSCSSLLSLPYFPPRPLLPALPLPPPFPDSYWHKNKHESAISTESVISFATKCYIFGLVFKLLFICLSIGLMNQLINEPINWLSVCLNIYLFLAK